ncbi:hypothetical protein BC827DRAFT_1384519 [Russula dissimulans]|nr:hypothetical protein BC827DRAFT_1384519 [Russula dissimulans]
MSLEPFNIYREQLSSLYQGVALWEPNPVKELYDQVSIDNVGYVHKGFFYCMFNVTLPPDDPSNNKLGSKNVAAINPANPNDPNDPNDPNENKLDVERMEDLILVSGCTLVTSWAAAAFVDPSAKMEISLAVQSFNNGGAHFTWSNIHGMMVYHNSHSGPRCTYESMHLYQGLLSKAGLPLLDKTHAGRSRAPPRQP